MPLFVITSAYCGQDVSVLEPEIRDIFTQSDLFKDPKRLNTFAFVLDHEGRLVHQFHGLPGGGTSRSNYPKELAKAIAKLNLPKAGPANKGAGLPGLPDLPKRSSEVPAGVRLLIRQENSRLPIVEVVAMKAEDWQPLTLPSEPKELDAELLKEWLVWMYPAAIRAVDATKPFQKFSGKLTLEPAGADKKSRYALLRGAVRLAKGNEAQSTFEGKIAVVLSYGLDTPRVKSLRGIIEGDYILTETQRIRLKAAIESRPDD